MYNIELANVKSIVADIVAKHNVENVAFVGCGASKAELYPAKYFLANCSRKLRVGHGCVPCCAVPKRRNRNSRSFSTAVPCIWIWKRGK